MVREFFRTTLKVYLLLEIATLSVKSSAIIIYLAS